MGNELGKPDRQRAAQTDGSHDLINAIYSDLRKIASWHARKEDRSSTFGTTVLVHEVYLKLAENTNVDWNNEAHVRCLAVRAMQWVLVDRARRRKTQKRGVDRVRVPYEDSSMPGAEVEQARIDFADAISKLQELSPRAGDVALLHGLGGLDQSEVAESLGVSDRTVRSDWKFARAWLADHFEP